MGRLKDWGLRIAQMLFEQHMTVDAVVDSMAIQLVEEDGVIKEVELDKAWLREQVTAVKNNRRSWGYGYHYESYRSRKERGAE